MAPRQQSQVWLYFEKSEDCESAVCQLCTKTISFANRNNSNLLRHIKMKHPHVKLDTGSKVNQSKGEHNIKSEHNNHSMIEPLQEFVVWQVQGEEVVATDHTGPAPPAQHIDSKPIRTHPSWEIEESPNEAENPPVSDRTIKKFSKKPRQRSCIWNYFDLSGCGKKVQCRVCSYFISYANRGTSNMKRHVRLKHPTIRLRHQTSKRSIDEDEYSSNKRRKRSMAWNHFMVIEAEKKAKCKICSFTISFSNKNVSNLLRHLRKKHPSAMKSCQNAWQSSEELSECTENLVSIHIPEYAGINEQPGSPYESITSPRSSKPKMKLHSYIKPARVTDSKAVDRQLLRVIVKEYQPLRLFEEREFKKFLELVSECPGYTLPTRQTITNELIPSLYERTREEVKEKLAAASAVCLTTDSWTSTDNNSFLAVTAHFIQEDNSKLASYVVGCVHFPDRHSPSNVADALLTIANEYKIENKISAVVSDNMNNIQGVISVTGWQLVPCFAHTLNLVVQDGMKANIQNTMRKVRCLVEYFKRNELAIAQLKTTLKQMELPDLKLKQEVPTSWTSTYVMLERVLQLKDAILSVMSFMETDLETLTDEDWKIASQIAEVLEVFNDVTFEVSSEKYVCLSNVLLYTENINDILGEYLTHSEFPLETIDFVRELKDSMTKRFKYVNELAIECTLLDPRFKKAGFMGDDLKFQKAYDSIKTKLSNEVPQNPESSSTHEENPNEKKKSKAWSKFDALVEQIDYEVESVNCLDRYLQEIPLGRQENPLEWWTARRKIYPALYGVAKQRLCIVATSVPCERIYSKSGLIMNERRAQLKDSNLGHIIFLNQNL